MGRLAGRPFQVWKSGGKWSAAHSWRNVRLAGAAAHALQHVDKPVDLVDRYKRFAFAHADGNEAPPFGVKILAVPHVDRRPALATGYIRFRKSEFHGLHPFRCEMRNEHANIAAGKPKLQRYIKYLSWDNLNDTKAKALANRVKSTRRIIFESNLNWQFGPLRLPAFRM
jgi:hypothetical protein